MIHQGNIFGVKVAEARRKKNEKRPAAKALKPVNSSSSSRVTTT